jgi:hypothetical protein
MSPVDGRRTIREIAAIVALGGNTGLPGDTGKAEELARYFSNYGVWTSWRPPSTRAKQRT